MSVLLPAVIKCQIYEIINKYDIFIINLKFIGINNANHANMTPHDCRIWNDNRDTVLRKVRTILQTAFYYSIILTIYRHIM